MKNTFAKILSIILIFLIASSLNFVYAGDSYEETDGPDMPQNSDVSDETNEGNEGNDEDDGNEEYNPSDSGFSDDDAVYDRDDGSYDPSDSGASDDDMAYNPEAPEATVTGNETAITKEDIEKYRTKNYFEMVISEYFLSMGDYAQDYLSRTFKEEISIDKLVYNQIPMLNANFFTKSSNSSNYNAADVVRNAINYWFNAFQLITVVVIIIALIAAGIKTMLGTARGKTESLEILKKVVISVALVYLFPFVMRFAFDLNEAIIKQIYNDTHSVNTGVGTTVSNVSDFHIDELEERSPQYVSKENMKITAGSDEATQIYLGQIETYAKKADMMRIMRAFAGVTLRFMYIIFWYIMLAQTYIMLFIYVKRYITIVFLIAIYPLVIIGYVTGNLFGEKGSAFNTWCVKYFSTIFLQTIHAIIYGVISGIIMVQLQDALLMRY